MSDASFNDGDEKALRLRALSADDLSVVSALLQDSVGETGKMSWLRKRRRFSLLLSRFRWEDVQAAEKQGRPYERVQCLLNVENVTQVRATGVTPDDPDLVVSPLEVVFEPAEEPSGVVRIVLAGDGEIAIDVECLELTLTDMSRPHAAIARQAPSHADT